MTSSRDLPLDDDEVVCAAAIASVGLSPSRLRRLLTWRPPAEAWSALVAGGHPGDPSGALMGTLTSRLRDETARRLQCAGMTVRVLGLPGYPPALSADPEAPAVVFGIGDLDALSSRPRVAVVGTRSASPTGCAVAAELAGHLVDGGVSVVSGLARGIDAAAHAGALAVGEGAATVAVAGTALDAPAAVADGAIRAAVGARGVVLSEIPPGVAGARWRFAVRNRIVAALADVVVVVECHERGGALHTVSAARKRQRTVAAFPGSVRSPASAGTNALLVKGARAVRHAGDVFDLVTEATGLDPRRAPVRGGWAARFVAPRSATGRLPVASTTASKVRRVLDLVPATLDVVVGRAGLPVGDVALALEVLAEAGLVVGEHGWWSLAPG